MPLAEPIWCAFCADRPMVGQMIVMIDGTREQVGTLSLDEGAACDRCGRAWTGAVIAEPDDQDRVIALQYNHPDFEKITEDHIRRFSGEHACSVCGDPTDELPLWASERVLRASPHLALDDENFSAICTPCAKNHFSQGSENAEQE